MHDQRLAPTPTCTVVQTAPTVVAPVPCERVPRFYSHGVGLDVLLALDRDIGALGVQEGAKERPGELAAVGTAAHLESVCVDWGHVGDGDADVGAEA